MGVRQKPIRQGRLDFCFRTCSPSYRRSASVRSANERAINGWCDRSIDETGGRPGETGKKRRSILLVALRAEALNVANLNPRRDKKYRNVVLMPYKCKARPATTVGKRTKDFRFVSTRNRYVRQMANQPRETNRDRERNANEHRRFGVEWHARHRLSPSVSRLITGHGNNGYVEFIGAACQRDTNRCSIYSARRSVATTLASRRPTRFTSARFLRSIARIVEKIRRVARSYRAERSFVSLRSEGSYFIRLS